MDAKRKPPGTRLPPDLVELVRSYVQDKKWTNAAALHQKLQNDLVNLPLGQHVPDDPRSIRTLVRRFQLEDESGPWTLSRSRDTNTAAVMAVIRALVDDPDQRTTALTNGEARLVTALYQVHADIPPLEALRLARRYTARDKGQEPTDGLDNYVALRGWTLTAVEYRAYADRGLFEGVGKYFVTATDQVSARGEAYSATVQISGELKARHLKGDER